jgi:MinD superfamily P-loop ATPase
VPIVDEAKCNGCGRCGEVCQFSAIVALGAKAMTFSSLCHGCGSCILSCPERAISEGEREVGVLEKGIASRVEFAHGRLRIGEAMSPPLIRAVKKLESDADVTIIDCPPGTSCPVVQSVRGSDYIVLVTEPTPFGLNDLILAVEMIRIIGLPFGVVVNRMGAGDRRTHDYCIENNIPIIGTIPDDRRIAESYSRGRLIFDDLPEYRERFVQIIEKVLQHIPGRNHVASGTASHI